MKTPARRPPRQTSSQTPPPTPPPQGARRKRTIAITLLALGAGAVTIGVFSGSGSGSRDRPRTYRDVASCEADKLLSSVECESNFKQALSSHERSAPAYQSREACEKEYGPNNCANPSANSGRGSMFIPLMAGYLLAQRASGGYQSAPLYRRPGDPANEFRQSAAFPFPITQPSSGSSSSSNFRSGSSWGGSSTTTSRPSTGSSSSGITSTSRGGFGSSARGSSSS